MRAREEREKNERVSGSEMFNLMFNFFQFQERAERVAKKKALVDFNSEG